MGTTGEAMLLSWSVSAARDFQIGWELVTEIRVALGSVRFERSVTLSAGLGSSLRGISAIQNALWVIRDVIEEQVVGARTSRPYGQVHPPYPQSDPAYACQPDERDRNSTDVEQQDGEDLLDKLAKYE